MQKQTFLQRFWALFDPAGTKKYVTQISLILLSLYIATSVDRCKEANKDQAKLQEYLRAIQVDIKEEIKVDAMNLGDCEQDIKNLGLMLYYAKMPQPDSVELAMNNFAQVFWRGVFRGFHPTTFDLMMESGDANLLKDINLRNKLATVFAFRRTVIQADLAQFDQQTSLCAAELGKYVDLARYLFVEEFDIKCVIDREGFARSPHNEVFLLHRLANLRAFHLENALEDLKEVEKLLTEHTKTF